MAKYIHSMIRVLNEERSVRFYQQVLGLSVAKRLDFPEFTLIYLADDEGQTELELTINKGRVVPYDLGDGHGHVAYTVDDLDATHARLLAEGLAPRKIVDFAPGGQTIARFFFIADPDGYQIEVLQRGGHYK